MTYATLTDVRARFSEYVRRVTEGRERIDVVVNGIPAAVLMSREDVEAMEETIYWLSQPGIMDDVAEARSAPGISSEEMRELIEARRAREE